MTRSLLVAVMLVGLAVPAAQAQTGLFVGAHITGASLTYKDALHDLDPGSGIGVHAGLALSKSLGVLVNYDKITLGSSGGDTELEQWDLLGRLQMVGVGPVQAYLTAGVTGRSSIARFFDGSAGDFDFRGVNPTAGLTGQVMLTSKLAVDGGVMWTFGRFNDTQGYSLSRVEATGSRVFVGASYYLFGGR
ncbi:MAG: outer membrane beta-barrel protein [Gemmatimonadetes bacterium]|nr:outer membrane beta-barrel protein [Gemmatimonadota bacterium]